MSEIKFEEALKKLEKIVFDMENGSLSLEDSLKRYEEGVRLAKECTKKLEAAQKKVELLMKDSKGKFKLKNFEEPQDEEIKGEDS